MIIHGDCIKAMAQMAAESVDAVVTDPPYGLEFMGKAWDSFGREIPQGIAVSPDGKINPKAGATGKAHSHGLAGHVSKSYQAWCEQWAIEALRVAKPGAHLVAFGGTRMYHRLTAGIEDAGFEIRDCLMWLYGSGFPKGLNVVTELAKMAVCQSSEIASRVVQSSVSIRVRSRAGKDTIAVTCARILPVGELVLLTEIGGEVALHVPMDTWPSGWMARIGLNMTCSSSASLDEHYAHMNRCITATGKETITDEGTFSWLIGLHTSATTIRCSVILRNGCAWPAVVAGQNLNGDGTNTSAILIVTALGSATWNPVVRNAGANVALKPAFEPIILARKPTIGTVAANVLRHSTGALNIEACRIGTEASGGHWTHKRNGAAFYSGPLGDGADCGTMSPEGRWPANVCLDEDVAAMLDEQSDSGGASRFYKIAESDCILCGLSCVERDTMSGCETTPASTAARRSRTIRQIIDATALNPAHASLAERLALVAPSAGNLCETCGMSIVLALVEIKSSGSPQQASRVFRDSIPRSRSSILIQNLACFAELWTSTDTIPTTRSLSLLFGSVCYAIGNCTRPGSLESDSDQQRFRYSAKPSREERDFGCHDLIARSGGEATDRKDGSAGLNNPRAGAGRTGGSRNFHPTVKPVELMRWLVKLVVPINGVCLDPFTGSGTTGMACAYELRQFIGIEREPEYAELAKQRIAAVAPLFSGQVQG